VKDAHPVEPAPMDGIQAVALDEKEIQRVRRRRGQRLAAGPGAPNRAAGAPGWARMEVNWMPECSSCSRMRALKYGSPKAARAPKTASVLEASSEKNQTPGTPLTWTYVRTFSSCDWLTTGSGGRRTGRMPHMVNGVMLTQAWPPKVSRLSRGAISRCRRSAATGQCRKSNLSQVWYMTDQPDGRVRMDRRSIIAPLSQ
jgi:hypothetical protein